VCHGPQSWGDSMSAFELRKPTICRFYGHWLCAGSGFAGHAATPRGAYRDWARNGASKLWGARVDDHQSMQHQANFTDSTIKALRQNE
jgi:hypothetical protein